MGFWADVGDAVSEGWDYTKGVFQGAAVKDLRDELGRAPTDNSFAAYARPEEEEYAKKEGFLTEDARTLETAGLDDSRLFQKAKELRELSQGRAPTQPWEQDFRKRMNEAANRLYAGAGLGGSNRAAQQRAIRGGLAQKSGEMENSILQAREQEQRVATEELENLLITARSAGKSAALALASQHQQWLIARDERNQAQMASIIGSLATLAGVQIMN